MRAPLLASALDGSALWEGGMNTTLLGLNGSLQGRAERSHHSPTLGALFHGSTGGLG